MMPHSRVSWRESYAIWRCITVCSTIHDARLRPMDVRDGRGRGVRLHHQRLLSGPRRVGVPRRRVHVLGFISTTVGVCVALMLVSACATTSADVAGVTTPPRDAIVVLGHSPALDEHGVESETRARVERGIALFRERRASLLVFAGGPANPGEGEAQGMAELARERGVPESSLRLESLSRDTIENARFTVALLRKELAQAPRVLLVTSDYHIKRATLLFRCAGADVEPAPVTLDALSGFQRFVRSLREATVRVVYSFFDECARARATR